MVRRLHAHLLDDAGATLGEGPSWDARTGELVWVDILAGVVHLHGPDGDHRLTHRVGGHVASVMPAEEGGWLLATADGFVHLARDGTTSPLLAVEEDRPDLRFNDAKCDPWGQALAGTMRYDETAGSATLYRLEAEPGGAAGTADAPSGGGTAAVGTAPVAQGGARSAVQSGPSTDAGKAVRPGGGRGTTGCLVARPLLGGLGLANGLAWSSNGRTLYFIDSLCHAVAQYPYTPDGDLGPAGEVLAVEPDLGIPDGMCVDDTGCLWVALYGGGVVHRYRPDGRLDTVVDLPVPHPTSVAFGGPGGDRLFITTAGGHAAASDTTAGGHAAASDDDRGGTVGGTGARDDARDGVTADGADGRRAGIGGLWAVDPGVTGPPATPWRHPGQAPVGRFPWSNAPAGDAGTAGARAAGAGTAHDRATYDQPGRDRGTTDRPGRDRPPTGHDAVDHTRVGPSQANRAGRTAGVPGTGGSPATAAGAFPDA